VKRSKTVFDWFQRKQGEGAQDHAPTQSFASTSSVDPDPARQQRRSHREQLFLLVRQAMAGTPLPAKSYKFKVLSLDAAGLSFVVMVDLVGSPDGAGKALKMIEQVIMDTAATSHELQVKGVYWRFEAPAEPVEPAKPVSGLDTHNNPFAPGALAQGQPHGSVLEQVGQDEMLAFRKAQDQARERQAKVREAVSKGDPDGTERTQASPLSSTQFGDL
jgi:hypothetical protein